MREQLVPFEGRRLEVTGTVARYGHWHLYRDFYAESILITDIATLDGEPLTDHIWLPLSTAFAALDLRRRERVAFRARVARYARYYTFTRKNGRLKAIRQDEDLKLIRPTQIRRIAAEERSH